MNNNIFLKVVLVSALTFISYSLLTKSPCSNLCEGYCKHGFTIGIDGITSTLIRNKDIKEECEHSKNLQETVQKEQKK